MARKPPWRWRVECTSVPSDRRKILVPDADITFYRERGKKERAGSAVDGEVCAGVRFAHPIPGVLSPNTNVRSFAMSINTK